MTTIQRLFIRQLVLAEVHQHMVSKHTLIKIYGLLGKARQFYHSVYNQE